MAWRCPPGGALRYRVTLFQEVDPAARHLALIATGSGDRELALDRMCPRSRCPPPDRRYRQVIARFVAAGIEHIFLGYDHSISCWP
jgi:hypothetical protein